MLIDIVCCVLPFDVLRAGVLRAPECAIGSARGYATSLAGGTRGRFGDSLA